jgi:hypothetical protein
MNYPRERCKDSHRRDEAASPRLDNSPRRYEDDRLPIRLSLRSRTQYLNRRYRRNNCCSPPDIQEVLRRDQSRFSDDPYRSEAQCRELLVLQGICKYGYERRHRHDLCRLQVDRPVDLIRVDDRSSKSRSCTALLLLSQVMEAGDQDGLLCPLSLE